MNIQRAVILAVVVALAAGCASTVETTRTATVAVPAQAEWSTVSNLPLAAGANFSIEVDPAQRWTSGSWT